MSLPTIDIPIHLPFDIPLLIHPIFVHFAIAIPVIVLLIELINIKADKSTVSITSLFLLTLLMIVYLGAFFTGKADGSEAFALLDVEAKEELKEHKLLGVYLVYATAVLFLFKIFAMLLKRSWTRNIFLVLTVLFIAIAFKQGKDGGELVYEYGVNVKVVKELQDRIDEMQYDIDDLKDELKKAKETSSTSTLEIKSEDSTTLTKNVDSVALEDKNTTKLLAPKESLEIETNQEDTPKTPEVASDDEHNISKSTNAKSIKTDEITSEDTTSVHIPTH